MESRQTENKNSQHFKLKSVDWSPIGVKHNRTNWPGSWSRSPTLWGRIRVRLRLRARTRTQGDSASTPLSVWTHGLNSSCTAVRTDRTLCSQKNKDKSNEVTWSFLNIISGWCSIRFTPASSNLAIYSCFFHPCNFARIAFSTPAFSVAPKNSWRSDQFYVK